MSCDMMEVAGRCGWWQARLVLLLALPVLLTGMYGTNYVFLAKPADFRCSIAECANITNTSASWPPHWSEYSGPEGTRCERWPSDGGCERHSFDNSSRLPCESRVYQDHSSIVAEFDLGCQEWKRSLVGTLHNVGMLISLPVMGYVSDRWGRRSALVVSGTGAGLVGLCKSFVGSYPAYVGAEVLETAMGASVYPAAFVLLIEWLGVEQRILASLVLGIPLALGAATLALLDYLTGYWRLWARFAYPPSFLLLLYPWLLPESVRWLLTQHRQPEAVTILKKAAKCNNVPISDEAVAKMMSDVPEKVEIEDETLLKAFVKYPALRRRLSVCFVWWLSAVFVFYALAARAHALAGSAHANYALLSAAELPALVINTLLLDRVGRRPVLTAAFLLTAIGLIVLPLVSDAYPLGGTMLYLLGKLGATMSLNCLYVYTAELVPTRARHRLLAACSTVGRVGAVLAPLTAMLASDGWVLTLLFGSLPLASAGLTRLVPDTLGRRLPDTYRDLEPSPRESGPSDC